MDVVDRYGGRSAVKTVGWAVAVVVGYGVLLSAVFRFMDWPWNILVASLALFKGTVFWAITMKIRKLGTGRRAPGAAVISTREKPGE